MTNSQIYMFLLCLLTGSSCAVFYTKGKDTDYPRIGRRSFYTSGDSKHYPRIGRRSSISNDVSPAGLAAASPASFAELDKRSVFYDSPHRDVPRIGRRSGPVSEASFAEMNNKDLINAARRSQLLERLLSLKEELQTSDASSAAIGASTTSSQQDGEASVSGAGSMLYPLDIMFLAFDDDSDGILTKNEFVTGMGKYREENPLC